MTIAELLDMPRGLTLEEYEAMLKKKRRIQARLRMLTTDRDFEEDALDVLSNEVGSASWLKHCDALNKVNTQIERLTEQLDALEKGVQR